MQFQQTASQPLKPESAIEEVSRRSRQQAAIAELGQAALTGVEPDVLVGQTCGLVESVLDSTRCAVVEQSGDRFIFGSPSDRIRASMNATRRRTLIFRSLRSA